MAASENNTLGDLGKLPAEIRNEVYKLCLIAPNPVRIERVVKSKRQNRAGAVVRKHSEQSRYGLICTVLGKFRGQKRQTRNPAVEVVSISLLYVSKAINLEARSVLYGYNTFDFQSAPALSDFFQAYTSHSALIRNLKVKQVKSNNDPRHLAWLAHLRKPGLVSVSIEAVTWEVPWDAQSFRDLHRVADALRIWPLLKPFIRQTVSTSDQGIDAGAETHLSKAEQRKRFDALEFHISHTQWVFDSGKGQGTRIEDGERRRAKFHQEMLEVFLENAGTDE